MLSTSPLSSQRVLLKWRHQHVPTNATSSRSTSLKTTQSVNMSEWMRPETSSRTSMKPASSTDGDASTGSHVSVASRSKSLVGSTREQLIAQLKAAVPRAPLERAVVNTSLPRALRFHRRRLQQLTRETSFVELQYCRLNCRTNDVLPVYKNSLPVRSPNAIK